MFTKLISEHISRIKQSKYNKNYILVYKGLPVNFILELSKIYPLLFNKKISFTIEIIDLQKIMDNIGGMVKKVLEPTNGTYIMLYEQFILLSQKIDLSLSPNKFVIFENTFHKEYPNECTEKCIDIERAIDKGHINFKENKLFNTFYSNSTTMDRTHLVQYRDINQDILINVESEPFFEEKILPKLHYQETDDSGDIKTVIFPQSSNYNNFKNRIYSGDIFMDHQVVIADPSSVLNKEYNKELRILQYIFRHNEIPLDIKIRKTTLRDEYRQEFLDVLKKHWGSNSFRKLLFYKRPDVSSEKVEITQGAVLEEIVKQCELAQQNDDFSDIFLTSPTGSGKSVLFQIPAIYMAKHHNLVTIVISPLKALMYDQVHALKNRGVDCAAFINSDITLIERQKIINQIKKGEKSILYLSPELLLSYDIRSFIGERNIGLLVIDEAHLVTTWGRDFRVDYWYIGNYIRKLRKYSKQNFPVLALTATAVYTGKNDIVFETIESLNMQTPRLYIGNVRRDEIEFDINAFAYKKDHELSKMEHTKKTLIENVKKDIKCIAYFPWTNQIRYIMDEIPEEHKSRIGIYYGDVDKTEKQMVMHGFYTGEIMSVLATKAFGMGVDISDIRAIYHHAPSGNLSDYVQEIGRVARRQDIQGKAVVDFCDKDLKFTKILYGLSSIKQYQVKLVLQKIWDTYSQRKAQNFLISPEDFNFIFSQKEADLETKVKSTLLLLEKDLVKKYKYNILVVRPKSLYSVVFACVPKTIEVSFKEKYGKFCDKVSTAKANARQPVGSGAILDNGDIYQIRLDKIWEKYFNNLSFPMVKRKFFEENLFAEFNEPIFPKYKLTIRLKGAKEEIIEQVEKYFSVLENAFKKLQGKYFTSSDLEKILRNQIKKAILRQKIVDLIINLYSSPYLFDSPTRNFLKFDTFIQSKNTDTGGEVYRIISSAFLKVSHFAIQKIHSMFPEEGSVFEKYISTLDKESEFRIKIAYVLESLSLGNYELVGGQLPQIFVRINAPYKLKIVASKPDYTNSILEDINNRHSESVKIMESFFTSDMSNVERWDFLEKYFLGKQ